MAIEPTTQPSAGLTWQVKQVYSMAVICLVVGLAIGCFFRGAQSPAAPVQPAAHAHPSLPAGAMGGHTPSLEEMKQMADKKAAPLLEKLKSDPNNSDLLIQAGNLYKATHQFKEAAGYYDKALHVDPKNVAIRTEMASCLYYNGDVDGAIRHLQQALQYDPKDVHILGVILQRLLKVPDRPVHIAVVVQTRSHLGPNGNVFWIDMQRLVVVAGGFLELVGSFV